jgi:hypothetical protein
MDYARLKTTADNLLSGASQGTVEIGTTVSTPGATDIDAPSVATTWEAFDAVVRGVSSKYVDGKTVLATDLMAIIEADAEAEVGGLIRLDGVARNIVRVDNIPGAGTVVAQRVFIR